MAISFLSIISF